jgi:cytochrome c oxidase assembly protein subunit 11
MSTAPTYAMKYIEKQECFCFKTQTLAPGEAREMPVVFRVTADAPRELGTISLSYTFMEAPKGAS